MTYSTNTRSYNRSTEARQNKLAQKEATAQYEAGPKVEIEIGLRCRCRSFALAHDLSRHRELRSDYDWRLESERHGATYYPEGVK